MPTLFSTAKKSELETIQGVCLDIDETLSTHGKLTASAYAALWKLKNAGLLVVPITGRPAGWCDHIARFWPVDAVVGENGAFTFFMKDGVRRRIDTPARPAQEDSLRRKTRLEALSKKILSVFPHAKWASDQNYREFDLAIDVCEDVAAWSAADVDRLLRLCHDEGAHAKLSSVHVNAWFGDYDKVEGFAHWLDQARTESVDKSAPPPRENWLFIGDSPNDEPMFQAFTHTVGVANLAKYLDRLKHPPRWLTAKESGAGFAEMAEKLIG